MYEVAKKSMVLKNCEFTELNEATSGWAGGLFTPVDSFSAVASSGGLSSTVGWGWNKTLNIMKIEEQKLT